MQFAVQEIPEVLYRVRVRQLWRDWQDRATTIIECQHPDTNGTSHVALLSLYGGVNFVLKNFKLNIWCGNHGSFNIMWIPDVTSYETRPNVHTSSTMFQRRIALHYRASLPYIGIFWRTDFFFRFAPSGSWIVNHLFEWPVSAETSFPALGFVQQLIVT